MTKTECRVFPFKIKNLPEIPEVFTPQPEILPIRKCLTCDSRRGCDCCHDRYSEPCNCNRTCYCNNNLGNTCGRRHSFKKHLVFPHSKLANCLTIPECKPPQVKFKNLDCIPNIDYGHCNGNSKVILFNSDSDFNLDPNSNTTNLAGGFNLDPNSNTTNLVSSSVNGFLDTNTFSLGNSNGSCDLNIDKNGRTVLSNCLETSNCKLNCQKTYWLDCNKNH